MAEDRLESVPDEKDRMELIDWIRFDCMAATPDCDNLRPERVRMNNPVLYSDISTLYCKFFFFVFIVVFCLFICFGFFFCCLLQRTLLCDKVLLG